MKKTFHFLIQHPDLFLYFNKKPFRNATQKFSRVTFNDIEYIDVILLLCSVLRWKWI